MGNPSKGTGRRGGRIAAPAEPRRRLKRSTVAGMVWAVGTALQAAPAPSVPVTDVLHGVSVSDPFRNLEDLKNPQTHQWLLDQGTLAAAALNRIDLRDPLRERITELARSNGDLVRDITRRGPRLFYLRRPAGESQFKLVMRQGLKGAERVLVDPAQLAKSTGVPHAVNYFAPSWDGRTLAYGVSAGGSEQALLHVVDVATGKALREPVPRAVEGKLHWSANNRWLSVNLLRDLPEGTPDTETYLDSTVFVFDRQHPTRPLKPVFGPLVNPELKLDRLDVGELILSRDSPYMVARTTDTTVPEGKLYVARVSALERGPIRWQQVSSAADKVTDAQLRGGTLYLRTYADAPRGRIVALKLADPRMDRAVTVVPEPERGVLDSFVLGRQAIYTEVQSGFGVRVRQHDPAHPGAGTDVAPKLGGSAFALVDRSARTHELWLATSTWDEPSRIYTRSVKGVLTDTGLRNNARPAGVPQLEVTEVEVSSHDGVRVPLAVLHRKGLKLNGHNPTLLDGYGSYGITTQAWFDPRRYAWFERGGVMAFVNPRGSGAFGDAWHRAGFKTTKPNTWKDGIAAARWLIDKAYCSPATLGVEGGSAGGIFVGRSVTEAPELFAAAIFSVPIMDAVRSEQSANGATNTGEFGTVKDPVEFKALLEMSTYHQIHDGTAYPAVLLVHGMNDPRVDVWHSAKAAARLQQASTSGKPILLRLDAQAGHGVGSTAQQGYALLADKWAFLLWQFGLAGLKP
jgi:prolyl oligopeptidase